MKKQKEKKSKEKAAKVKKVKNRKQMKLGIQAKLMIFIIPLMVASFVALTVIAYNTAEESIVSKTEDLIKAQTTVAASDIENWHIKNQQTFDTVANTIINLKLSDAETLELFKGYYNVNDDYPNGFYSVQV